MPYKLNPITQQLDYYETGAASIGGSVSGATAGSVLFVGSGLVLAQDNAALFWDAANKRLGIGTASPLIDIHVHDGAPLFTRGITNPTLIDSGWGLDYVTGAFQIDPGTYYGMVYLALGANAYSVWQEFGKSRSTNGTSYAVVQNGDELGRFNFYGDDGDSLVSGAQMTVTVDGTPGNNDMPGKIAFMVSEDGSATPVNRLVLGNTDGNLFTPGAAARVGLRVKGHSGQSANLQTWEDSTPTVLCAIDATGAIKPVSRANTGAPNNSIYYSTDASKLVYKDSGGTVNNLY